MVICCRFKSNNKITFYTHKEIFHFRQCGFQGQIKYICIRYFYEKFYWTFYIYFYLHIGRLKKLVYSIKLINPQKILGAIYSNNIIVSKIFVNNGFWLIKFGRKTNQSTPKRLYFSCFFVHFICIAFTSTLYLEFIQIVW